MPVHLHLPSPTRRGLLGSAAALGALGALGLPATAHADPRSTPVEHPSTPDATPGLRVFRQRAAAAHTALQTHFAADDGSDLLREFHPHRVDDNPYSYEWPFSQARIATVQLSRTAGGRSLHLEELIASRDRGQERYWHLPCGTTGLPGYASATDLDEGAHGTYFYDDNSWVALAELEDYLTTDGERGDLDRVREVVALLRSAESTDPSLPSPGGLFWSQGEDGDRNTVATMPAAKVLLRLHQITGEQDLFDDAVCWVEWTRQTLLAPEGLFWDNIKQDGSIDKTFWTYNQGVPLGVEALLYEITGDEVHRERALALFDAIVEHYDVFTRGGTVDEQPVFFNAILCANLLYAESVFGADVCGQRVTQQLAARCWEDKRDPRTDLFTGRNDRGELEMLAQAGFTRLLALAATPKAGWNVLC